MKDVLGLALDETPDRRSALLDKLCAGEPELRAEVESLVAAHAAAGTFIDTPALDVPAAPEINSGDDADPLIGRHIGPYLVERCIGHGGMGAVYLARRTGEFEQSVAIKTIRRGMDSDLVVRRFRHERQILASLNHPHIARLFDGGTTQDGLPYFVMEYVEGTPIDRDADNRRLSIPDRLRLFLNVLDAVQYAHDHHIVHRDLKPGNVLVTGDGLPKLLDFGIAKLLDAEADGDSTMTALARPMTPDYASPEQILGQPITPATDVYALGLLLYELLSGVKPFHRVGRTPDERSRAVCEEEPERPSTAAGRRPREGIKDLPRHRLGGALDAIVMKTLRKTPESRYPTVAALADDVRRWLEEKPVAAGRDAFRYRATRAFQRHRPALSVAALLLAAVAVTAVAANRWTTSSRRSAAVVGQVAAAAHAPRPSMAVASFANLSGRPADQWLSTALAEMLTTELAGGGQLRVASTDQVTRAARDVAVDAVIPPRSEAVERLRRSLGTDYLVVGSFATSDGGAARSLRIDVRVFRSADEALAVSGVGDEAQLFSMMAAAGRDLRSRLGLPENTADATRGARAAFPTSLEATRLYSEGLAHLRLLDAVQAETLLTRAAALEPGNPMIQTALASAWTALGYDGRAQEAAQRAFDSSRALTREDRLKVEGRLYEAQRAWSKAIDVYRTLWGFFSDNVEYGLRLAEAQSGAGQHQDALATIVELRHAPAPQNEDPRIDLAESQAASGLAEFPREQAALARAIERAERSGSRQLLARARLLEGRSHYNQGAPQLAQASLEVASQIFREAGDRAGEAAALNSLGTVLDDQQDITRAQVMYEQSLATSEEIGDRRAMSAALNNLGILMKDLGRLAEARSAHERSLALRREIGDRNWTAVSLSNIGVVLFEEDRLRDATNYYQESLAMARAIGDKRGLVRALHNLAIVQRELGQLDAARAGYEESLATRVEIGDKRGQVMAHVELGIVRLQQGAVAAARASEEQAIRLAVETRLKPGEAQARFQLGEIALAAGDLAGARRQHEQALALRREMKETRTILESRVALALVALEEGRPEDAEREAQAVIDQLGQTMPVLRALAAIVVARTHLARKDISAATRALTIVRSVASQSDRVSLRSGSDMLEAEIDAAAGRSDRARQRLDALGPTLRNAGLVLAEIERRLLRLRIDQGDGRLNIRADATALERDARALGAGLVASRAQFR